MGIKKINEFPEGSGSLSNDDVFLFMDDPSSGSGTTKKISLSQIADAIGEGVGGNADTGDITFDNVKIIGGGNGSGDGNNKGTIELVPDNTLYNNDQYLIIDPTAPNHIHLRAGGDQDYSNAELILGGEQANVKIIDNQHQVSITSSYGGDTSVYFAPSCAGYLSSDIDLPIGTTFVHNDITYVIDASSFDTECGGNYLVSISVSGGASVDSLVAANIIGSVSLIATLPFTDNNWTFNNQGHTYIPGNIYLTNGTSVTTGTFDNGTSGQNGISLNCAVGYELNWQGGHLKSTYDNGTTASTIYIDSPIQLASGITFSDGSTQTSAGIDSNSAIVCKVGDDLAAAYNAAKTLTPGGNSLSASNRATLIIMPGNYTVASALAIDTDFVDVIGLGSVKLERGAIPAVNLSGGINVTASNVRVKGISVGADNFTIVGATNQIFEDCTGGDYSFAGGYSLDENDNPVGRVASGSFINCVGGNKSFAGDTTYGGTASGSFINCVSGNSSFASNGYASGTFKNCLGGNLCFGAAEGGSASGIFIDCVGGDGCFGSSGGPASGSFANCVGGNGSFGGYGTASGTFKDCTGGVASFGGGSGTASGIFDNCTGGAGSLGGGYNGTASGTFNNCFSELLGFGGGGTASGTFNNCSGGIYSFGVGTGTASGIFLRCILTSGSFQTLSSGGKYRLCIDGDYNVINADYVAPQ